jgi:hypothetical protein
MLRKRFGLRHSEDFSGKILGRPRTGMVKLLGRWAILKDTIWYNSWNIQISLP